MDGNSIPTYAGLMSRSDGKPAGSSWGVFGEQDDRGTANFATPERLIEALKSIRRGKTIGLDYPVNAFELATGRKPARHTIFAKHEDARDDYLDGFFLQSTSHIDGLRHRRHHDHGFYNGVADGEIDVGTAALGVGKWADTPIAGRGVLVDIDAYHRKSGRTLDFEGGEAITVDLIDRVAAAQGVAFIPGDILLLRTGWARHYLAEATAEQREAHKTSLRSPGLLQSRATLEWLWDNQFSMVASDNIAIEALPVSPESPFRTATDGGMMHQDMIALLGLVLGELWDLDRLAADCHAEGTYDCFLTCKPLNLVAGVGSPANAIAIR
jgi:kynurenine formamidase